MVSIAPGNAAAHEARCAIFRMSTGVVDAKTVAITNSRS
jgi:hypothetical protein